MRKYSFRKFAAPKYIIDSLSMLLPPEDLTVSMWAEKYRVLDMKSSAMPGYWRNSVTPYLAGIMDEFNNYETEEICFCKPTQVGGTEAMQNMLGWIVAQDPAPTMVVYPTIQLGKETSDNRLRPMFTSSPQLVEHFDFNNSSVEELQFDGMFVAIAGSNSPSGLASKPIKYLFLDEVDKYPFASKKEADPISLARERTKTFRGRKVYACSTPTLRTGQIWKMKEEADVEKHYQMPCPHCGEFIEFVFSQLRWPGKEDGLSHADRAAQAFYVCQACGGVINDRDKTVMLQKGEWRAVRKRTEIGRSVAFWLSTLYSPFTSFEQIAAEFMESKDDPDKLHNFVNSWLAEPWEDTKLKTSADLVMERRTELPEFTVPDWAKLITGGVDVQENCLYYTVRAWGDNITSQLITRGQAFSWAQVEEAMNIEYEKPDGTKMLPALVLVDSGDQTDDVYDFCARNSEWALPSKGTDTMLSHYKISNVNKTESRAYGMKLILVDVGKYKDLIASRMMLENGPKSWMVFAGCDREYAEQVTSEHKVVERNSKGFEKYIWKKKQSKADNHYLDCEVYSACAADILGVRSMHLKAESTEPPKASPKSKTTPKPAEDDWLSNGGDWGGEAWI